MGGSGAPTSRKTHTKSRNGCKTCKRRHIRCDETYPQCRNCTKHNVRCDYMDVQVPEPNFQAPPSTSCFGQDAQQWVEGELNQLGRAKESPYLDLSPRLRYNMHELRLLHHVSTVATQMNVTHPNCYTLWTQQVPAMAGETDFVMHSLLALSAAHLSWMSNCNETHGLMYHHRGLALKGLQKAINQFSRENSDAVLASSVLLSWQALDWSARSLPVSSSPNTANRRSWQHLMQGTQTVLKAMHQWKNESCFEDFMDAASRFPVSASSQDTERGQEILSKVLVALRRLHPYVMGNDEERRALSDLISAVKNIESYYPFKSIDNQFEFIQPLRAWLFTLKVPFLRRVKRDTNIMILLAHYYATCLAVEPMFPALGPSFFGSMSVGPIEELQNRIRSRQLMGFGRQPGEWPLDLMDFPDEMVGDFRRRMGWVRIEDLPSPVLAEKLESEMDFNIDPQLRSSSYSTCPSGNPLHTGGVCDPRQCGLVAPIATNMNGYDISAFAGINLVIEQSDSPVGDIAYSAGSYSDSQHTPQLSFSSEPCPLEVHWDEWLNGEAPMSSPCVSSPESAEDAAIEEFVNDLSKDPILFPPEPKVASPKATEECKIVSYDFGWQSLRESSPWSSARDAMHIGRVNEDY